MMRNQDAAATSAAENLKAPLVLNLTGVYKHIRISLCCEINTSLGLLKKNSFLSK